MTADAEHTITITNNWSKFSEDHTLNTLFTSVRFNKFMVLGWNPAHLAGVIILRYAKEIWQPFAVDKHAWFRSFFRKRCYSLVFVWFFCEHEYWSVIEIKGIQESIVNDHDLRPIKGHSVWIIYYLKYYRGNLNINDLQNKRNSLFALLQNICKVFIAL